MTNLKAIKLALMTAHGVATRGMDDATVLRLAYKHGVIDSAEMKRISEALAQQNDTQATTTNTTQEQTTMTTPTATAPANDVAAQLTALLAQLAPQPQAPAIDEAQIVELIKKHTVRETVVNIRRDDEQLTEQRNVGVTHSCFDTALKYLSGGLNVFFYGRSGSGKSTTAAKLAKALDLEFYGMGSILTKFELLGSFTKDRYNASIVRQWLENPNGGVLNIDEIDGSCPRALVNIMPILDDNGAMTFLDGVTLKRTEKHLIVASANTTGAGANAAYVGRNRLDGATLNRFVRIEHDYDARIEDTLAEKNIVKLCREFRRVCEEKGFNGSLVTPRTIKQAGRMQALAGSTSELRKLITPILRQGLNDQEWQHVARIVETSPL